MTYLGRPLKFKAETLTDDFTEDGWFIALDTAGEGAVVWIERADGTLWALDPLAIRFTAPPERFFDRSTT